MPGAAVKELCERWRNQFQVPGQSSKEARFEQLSESDSAKMFMRIQKISNLISSNNSISSFSQKVAVS
jgi:hypothetical protein